MNTVTIIHGPQGSGKTTLASLIKEGLEKNLEIENPSVEIIEIPDDCTSEELITHIRMNSIRNRHCIVCLQNEYTECKEDILKKKLICEGIDSITEIELRSWRR